MKLAGTRARLRLMVKVPERVITLLLSHTEHQTPHQSRLGNFRLVAESLRELLRYGAVHTAGMPDSSTFCRR